MAKTLFIEDELISLLIRILGYTWKEDNDAYAFPYLVNSEDEILSSDEFEYLGTPLTELNLEKGGTMMCDGILFFGDCCVEFHDAEELDAYHWVNFTDESVKKMASIVRNILNSQK